MCCSLPGLHRQAPRDEQVLPDLRGPAPQVPSSAKYQVRIKHVLTKISITYVLFSQETALTFGGYSVVDLFWSLHAGRKKLCGTSDCLPLLSVHPPERCPHEMIWKLKFSQIEEVNLKNSRLQSV